MVGQRIRYYRKTKGLTQEELAQGICSVSYLSKIEKGDAKSSEEVINMLCERLGISPEEVDEGKILEMLNEWNMLMVDRQFEEADNTFLIVKERMEGVTDPNLRLRYELFHSRYLMVIEPPLLNETKQKLDNIGDLFDHLSNDLKFYYYMFWGMYYNFNKKYNEALTYLHKAEKQFNQTSNVQDSEAAVNYYLLALTYSFLMRVTSITTYTFKAIHIFDRDYNYSRSADCQILLGISYRRSKHYDLAEMHLKHALKYSTMFKDETLSGIIYHNLGYISSCKKEHPKAIDRYEKSLGFKKSQSPQNMANTIYLLAAEHYELKNYEKVKELIKSGLTLINEEQEAYYNLMILSYKIEGIESDDFIQFLRKKALPFFENKGIWEYVSNYAELLADMFFNQGHYKKASEYYRVANNARKNIF
ncbi:helix-turn-helix domain-containing protein [Fictibacillus nanhaiensis]|jgi:HTH-type transcriptional regulator, quorum sensing regulator NprR|uniref:helix-turn-helix domain-containing protein n=1 Tax=Fictibacillus nanhaiensis TaxID=742169 RepID=UPI00203E556D|nr:helix-turn-helix domain-containing protein [Fictibacillus nanhaiensis]MCM3733995.1 helix-turn-helix domain-containing protein [Fictibacillus nanhaiensis]